ncbi:unnamed protein product [Arctogadus glacialis]
MAVMSHDRWVARELDVHSVYVLGMRESVCGCASRNVAPHREVEVKGGVMSRLCQYEGQVHTSRKHQC